jgi:FkbM family methyltransferase
LNNSYLDFTEGGSISQDHYSTPDVGVPEVYYQVNRIRLVDFIQNTVFHKHEEIYILKMDIEGAEFETLEDVIHSGVYRKIKYLFCETHARFFNDGDEKLRKLESLIQDNNITNIFLDWV